MVNLSVGMKAPFINIPRDGGTSINTSKISNPYVIYFYPKDDTPGCTTEAINFSEDINFFNDNNITVIGISKDTVEKHDKFIKKHSLSVILGSDQKGDVCESFGVWVEKSMYGRKYMGIERSTFLVDSNGNLQKIWKKVKVKGHVDDVINSCKEMLGT
ncbi:MAG: putative peroxiredoxin bcp [Alphaproteobacteria bacterium MarineAlpha9_Bin3]|nr:MAG: putative peroxiredoxin bcp [Alphaproteobacteria bacterium MarineAlpha9_Bin3]|tara:strand:- start:14071 stop:14544 length:474 start_codon:yes stop_codon:yes gene_type:complete